jgi:hypothetical protein
MGHVGSMGNTRSISLYKILDGNFENLNEKGYLGDLRVDGTIERCPKYSTSVNLI